MIGNTILKRELKVIAINEDLVILKENAVRFDEDLPDFKTTGGVHPHSDGVTVTAPTLMWIQALDLLLDKLKADNLDFSKVAAISGSGQQHGSVFWKKGAENGLKSLHSGSSLCEQLKDCFSVADSPIWMDASTTKQCKELEAALGGAMHLAEITGSRAYERFTGNQIAKIFEKSPSSYNNTEACAENLETKLGPLVKSTEILGKISKYYVEKYGFSPDCEVIAFTGDNPASLAGMRLQEGDICVSLGTSDTLFLWLTQPKPALEGHIFINPVNSDSYMALLCFKNGSLTREKIRDEFAGASWETFTKSLKSVPSGNNGNIGIYFDVMEIQPLLSGRFRINKEDQDVPKFNTAEEEVRAVIEGQFMSRRVHAENLGFNILPKSRVLATGGASQNKSILKVLANILNAPVYIQDVSNSASLGAAYQAMRGSLGHTCFNEILNKTSRMVRAAEPDDSTVELYTKLCARYKQLEERVSQS
ncbi:xylulose kinase isoform X1 [Octopus vulgaris]|uniref:Xylulose kinase n=1 Tax=Octopus vulgaris TaxID=6645 RepID=A0AA36AUW3_OCTVU|nr:xylulose kinase isoform X1 [Octopus vulgaris]